MAARPRPRSLRGSTLVAAATFILALTIMVVGTLNALTNAKISLGTQHVKEELTYAAIGFVHAVKADLLDGDPSTLAEYRFVTALSEVSAGYEIEASYGGGEVHSRTYCFFQLNGDADSIQTITAYAQQDVNGEMLTVSVTAQVEYESDGAGVFRFGAFGDSAITMDSNSQMDSYDSEEGAYDKNDANANGAIGSNTSITMEKTKIYGDAAVAAGGTIKMKDGGSVSGDVITDAAVASLPSFTMPAAGSLPATSFSGSSIASGDHHFSSWNFSSNKTITITGPATIVVDNVTIDSNVKFNMSGGRVDIIVKGNFKMSSNCDFNPDGGLPKNFTLTLLGDNITGSDKLVFDSNTNITGRIFAPNALIDFDSNAVVTGQVIAKKVHFNSNARVHFDETLPTELYPNVGGAAAEDEPARFVAESWSIDMDPTVP